MSNSSKNKGKSFERDVAKFLGEIFKLNFERVPNSGAFIGGANRFRENKLSKEQTLLMDGDIITPVELAHVSIECKSYKDIRWHLMYKKDGIQQLNKWIDQASRTTKPLWFLFFKINNQGSFVVYDSSYSEFVVDSYSVYYYNNKKYYITDMAHFFNKNHVKILNFRKV